MIKKIAVAYLNELRNEELLWSLLQAGFDAQVFVADVSVYSTLEEDALKFVDYIKDNMIDAFLTYDFCPALSDGCEKAGIPYIAWIYDCPLSTIYENAVTNNCNYFYTFDKKQLEELKILGCKHARYQPLGTNMLRNAGIVIDKSDEDAYSCNISFVGNLSSEEYYLYAEKAVSMDTRDELYKIVDDAYGIWDGEDRIHGRLSNHAYAEFEEAFKYDKSGIKMPLDTFVATNVIAYHLDHKERIDMLERLSAYNVQFFTGNSEISIPGVCVRPKLKQIDELPKVYYLSKVNMNVTKHTILSGVPMRVFEIMGVGGFALSNYQPEIEELFSIDREIVVFKSFDEMEDKAAYYLKHERQRLEICINGYNAVKERFDDAKTIASMIEIAFKG